MSKRARQYIGILAAVIAYYLIHEGAHLVIALCFGVFRKINFMGLGMQIDVFADRMSDVQMGIFCLAGAVATLICSWALILSAGRICRTRNKAFKAAMWYVTLAMLLLDPLYLSVLCGFFGGGDMNGIRLIMPEAAARIGFAVIGVGHAVVIRKRLLPEYTKAFQAVSKEAE